MLRIGQIEYANCTPIFTALSAHFDCAGYRFVKGVPATLNAMLAAGTIEVSPSSSIEYGKSPENYCLLPDLSISAIGPVKSVLLFSRIPIEGLDRQTVGLTTESDTSVNLLKILLDRYYGFTNSFQRCGLPLAEALREFPALLLIGDAALKGAMASQEGHIYDLGELWYRFTGLPFVFALWIARREAAVTKRGELAQLAADLVAAKTLAYESYAEIADTCREREWLGRGALVDYWQTISYDLTTRHLDGLTLFYRHAAELGILAREPELRIFNAG